MGRGQEAEYLTRCQWSSPWRGKKPTNFCVSPVRRKRWARRMEWWEEQRFIYKIESAGLGSSIVYYLGEWLLSSLFVPRLILLDSRLSLRFSAYTQDRNTLSRFAASQTMDSGVSGAQRALSRYLMVSVLAPFCIYSKIFLKQNKFSKFACSNY